MKQVPQETVKRITVSLAVQILIDDVWQISSSGEKFYLVPTVILRDEGTIDIPIHR
jgi:hypothetical protein